jgi:hypothetical protein
MDLSAKPEVVFVIPPELHYIESNLTQKIEYIGKSKQVKGIFSLLKRHLDEGWRI